MFSVDLGDVTKLFSGDDLRQLHSPKVVSFFTLETLKNEKKQNKPNYLAKKTQFFFSGSKFTVLKLKSEILEITSLWLLNLIFEVIVITIQKCENS